MKDKKFKIIPSIDLIDGICVRLTQGDYLRKDHYNKDPLKVSLYFQDIGISRLHLVDLDGAKSGKISHWRVLEKISKNTDITIDFGGGIKRDQDIRVVFECGATIATIGSIAVKNLQLMKKWIKFYGSNKIFIGMDVNNKKIAINGWKKMTDIYYCHFLKETISSGVENYFCTDISKDGLLSGSSLELYELIITTYPKTKIVASGGISNFTEIQYLKDIGCYGIILGKALYENKITISTLREIMKKC
ncbi:phosphoribosylformimino-5-aminoimidazole carboxamide [Candidatus Uzinura diaspidicola str. ASNER]|uniref:1-(5-phosphoribosyl)-5-[(5-phosphoribosylamino)methylideneamino] imidazole-4-carboxamide isomerase n=1 Tax=Candidatus Uzinura diaspidicola str. ASNER TaxID=1133592 RepID=L7VFV3_9FLAO|nr:phosphoribosylformimino-5-aminoimidazole carboxamide [Candidatus Uzinura diaspidicola str. ASNER]